MSQTERVVYALPFVPKTAKETTDDPILRQVAGYARVSTSEEEQQNSYEAQIEYYTNYIQSHEGWAFAGMYADVCSPYGQIPNDVKWQRIALMQDEEYRDGYPVAYSNKLN